MNRKEILEAVVKARTEKYVSYLTAQLLFIRGTRIWWLIRDRRGNGKIERAEYEVN